MNQEEKHYLSYRSFLLVIVLFSVINVALINFKIDSSFYFSAFIPLIASVYSKYYLTGAIQYIVFGFLVVGIIALFLICWFASKKHYRWLLYGAYVYTIDTVFLCYYIFVTGFKSMWILDIIFHVFMLGILYWGAMVGKKEFMKPLEEIEPIEKEEAIDNASNDEIDYQILDEEE